MAHERALHAFIALGFWLVFFLPCHWNITLRFTVASVQFWSLRVTATIVGHGAVREEWHVYIPCSTSTVVYAVHQGVCKTKVILSGTIWDNFDSKHDFQLTTSFSLCWLQKPPILLPRLAILKSIFSVNDHINIIQSSSLFDVLNH